MEILKKMNEEKLATEQKVLQFIKDRFSDDCNWTDGNCYYFAVILKARFPKGKIYYDVRLGHFVYHYHNKFYDWLGVYECNADYLVPWDVFEMYDPEQKKRIIQNCIL